METCERNMQNMISEFISDDIPPQRKITNMVISILMHFYSSVQIEALHAALSHMSSNDMWRN